MKTPTPKIILGGMAILAAAVIAGWKVLMTIADKLLDGTVMP